MWGKVRTALPFFALFGLVIEAEYSEHRFPAAFAINQRLSAPGCQPHLLYVLSQSEIRKK